MPGIKKIDGPHKYNKVNQQKKYHLLTLFYNRQLTLREAASVAGINYLTAKTIIFFHKNNHKSYQFDLKGPTVSSAQAKNRQAALYTTLKKKNPVQEKLHFQKTRIEVICSIGNVLNPLKSHNAFSDLNPQNMCPLIKSEQVISNTHKNSQEAPKEMENTPSPYLAAVPEPHLDQNTSNLKPDARVQQHRSNPLNRVEVNNGVSLAIEEEC